MVPMASKTTLNRQIAIRVTQSDFQRLDALVDRISLANRNSIARTALRIGLDNIEKNPSKLFQRKPTKNRSKRTR